MFVRSVLASLLLITVATLGCEQRDPSVVEAALERSCLPAKLSASFADIHHHPKHFWVDVSVDAGVSSVYTVRGYSVGGDILRITGFELDSALDAAEESPVYRVVSLRACLNSDCSLHDTVAPDELTSETPVFLQGNNSYCMALTDYVVLEADIEFVRPAGRNKYSAQFSFESNADSCSSGCGTWLTTWQPTAGIEVAPEAVVFEAVAPGTAVGQEIAVLNSGSGDLVISQVAVRGSDAFSLQLSNELDPTAVDRVPILEFGDGEAFVVKPYSVGFITVVYSPDSRLPASGRVRIESNAGESQYSVSVVELLGNGAAPE